jgi:hypothetical protein
MISTSGEAPFQFRYRDDLSSLPAAARPFERELHGGFAVDRASGHAYFGVPGSGIVRVAPDLTSSELIALPPELTPLNFHHTRLISFNGEPRLVFPANRAAQVVVVDLAGNLDCFLATPTFKEYAAAEFKPTSAVARDGELFVADGYGANYISVADLSARRWSWRFGGKAAARDDREGFATAHDITATPRGDELVVVDRGLDRIVRRGWDGSYRGMVELPNGSRPCGIDFVQHNGRWLGATACLAPADSDRDAPLLILDGETLQVLSAIRPAEELGVHDAHHLHHAAWHHDGGELYLLVQAWNPGRYFVLQLVGDR